MLCVEKMIRKAPHKHNTWNAPEYVKQDRFLYDAMLAHAQKVRPPEIAQVKSREGVRRIYVIDQTVQATVDVINYCTMIIHNAEQWQNDPL